MKKLISTFLLLLTLASCSGNSKDTIQTGVQLKTNAFELYYPKSWSSVKGDIAYATVYSIDSLKLISFSRAPGDGMGKTVMSFEDTYKTFEASFLKDGVAEEINTENDIDVKIIKYNNLSNTFLFPVSSAPGTLALWNNGKTSYALIDQSDMHQADGGFKSVYESFKFLDN